MKNFLAFYSAVLLPKKQHVVKEFSFSKETLPHAHFDDSNINVFCWEKKKEKKKSLLFFLNVILSFSPSLLQNTQTNIFRPDT